jgi:streptogramin lyase
MAVFDAPRGTGPYGIAATPDGQVLFASLAGNYLGRISVHDFIEIAPQLYWLRLDRVNMSVPVPSCLSATPVGTASRATSDPPSKLLRRSPRRFLA